MQLTLRRRIPDDFRPERLHVPMLRGPERRAADPHRHRSAHQHCQGRRDEHHVLQGALSVAR
jgi:hypothetical protein